MAVTSRLSEIKVPIRRPDRPWPGSLPSLREARSILHRPDVVGNLLTPPAELPPIIAGEPTRTVSLRDLAISCYLGASSDTVSVGRLDELLRKEGDPAFSLADLGDGDGRMALLLNTPVMLEIMQIVGVSGHDELFHADYGTRAVSPDVFSGIRRYLGNILPQYVCPNEGVAQSVISKAPLSFYTHGLEGLILDGEGHYYYSFSDGFAVSIPSSAVAEQPKLGVVLVHYEINQQAGI